MKMRLRSGYDPLSLRRTKAGIAWCLKPAKESGLDIAPNPKLSPRFGESTRSRLFHTFDVLRRRGRGDDHGEHFPLLCWFGRPQGFGRSLCTTNRTKRPLASTDTPLGHDDPGPFGDDRLEGRFTMLLVNARHLKQVPGRKSDVRDCQWIAQLLQYGLLKGSFIPPRSQRELRDLTRHRTQLVEEKTRTANRIHKVLQDTNIKLSSVATDVLGVSGRAMLEALITGEEDPVKLAHLAQRKLRSKIPELEKALEGHLTEHHRFLLQLLWKQLAQQEELIAELDRKIEEQTRPFAAEIDRLDAVPGVDRRVAEVVLAEVGADM